ncbi:MAG: hypothetical protein ACFCBW_05540 [Candidatus Competibacterales bacterium]
MSAITAPDPCIVELVPVARLQTFPHRFEALSPQECQRLMLAFMARHLGDLVLLREHLGATLPLCSPVPAKLLAGLKTALRAAVTQNRPDLQKTLATVVATLDRQLPVTDQMLAEMETAARPTALGPTLAQIEGQLTRYVGPIASVLVKRGLAQGYRGVDLVRHLSRHLDIDQRREFVADLIPG